MRAKARRHAMAVAHARRMDSHGEVRASDRRREEKALNRERRAIGRALDQIVSAARLLR